MREKESYKIPSKYWDESKKVPERYEKELKQIDPDLFIKFHRKMKKWAVVQKKQGAEKIVKFYDDLDYGVKDVRRLAFMREVLNVDLWYRELSDRLEELYENDEQMLKDFAQVMAEKAVVDSGLWDRFVRTMYFDYGRKT